MGYGSLMNLPFIIALLMPALKKTNPENFAFTYGFVGTITGIASFVNGIGQGLSQPASGKYVSDCATERVKGFYFAFFWAFYMGSQTVGMIITAFALGYLEPYTFPLIMIVILIAGIICLLVLKKPIILVDRTIHTDLLDEDKETASISQDTSFKESMVIKYEGDQKESSFDEKQQ